MAVRAATRSAARSLSSASRRSSTRRAPPSPSAPASSAPFAARATFLLRVATLAALCPARSVAAAAGGAPGSGLTMGAAAAECPAPGAGEQCQNPLLEDGPFPAYDRIRPEHVVPGMRSLLSELASDLDTLEARLAAPDAPPPTWEGVVVPYETLTDRLDRVWGAVDHLKAVRDSPDLRAAVDTVQPERVAFGLRLSQSRPLYDAFSALKASPSAWGALTPPQRRAVDNELRDFTLGGVGLDGANRTRFNEIQQRLSVLSTSFSNHLLDATKAWSRLITDPAGVAGLPETARALTAQQAVAAGHAGATPDAGPWLITLDAPVFTPVMTHAADRGLREDVYRAYVTRASTPGAEDDNQPLMDETLKLRKEKAALLGYPSFAALSMASKMATEESAGALLEQLRLASRGPAEDEMKEVESYARAHGFPKGATFLNWDVTYYAERVREEKYELSDEALRPYFALPNVLDGLFALVKRLFDVDVVPADGATPVWHPDVRFFRLEKGGVPAAYFFFDPYSRPAEKRSGAWMNEVVGRWLLPADSKAGGGTVRLPVALMVCNQPPPVGDQPSLMTFRDVETVFHELGHALQHMLTAGNDTLTSGIRGIEWDAVELPSQFMENFVYDEPTLYSFARHWETAAPLPKDMYGKLLAARTYRAGTQTLRQVHLATADLFLHSKYDAAAHPEGIYASGALAPIDKAATVLPPLPEDRFLASFLHIFAGGYSAGYYSYLFAELMSADAFSAFEDALAAKDEAAVRTTGHRFRDTVLASGGGTPPGEVFAAFRGRAPTVDAMLRHKGLVHAS